jgi:hypothetical protein
LSFSRRRETVADNSPPTATVLSYESRRQSYRPYNPYNQDYVDYGGDSFVTHILRRLSSPPAPRAFSRCSS